MVKPQTALVWYFHQPWAVDDVYIADVLRESLDPLLSAHAGARAPATLAITGALVERLPRIAPTLLDRLRHAIDDGLIEIAATFHHEIFPHLVEPGRIAAHLRRDVATKRTLLGAMPKTFIPANFAWTPALAPLLARAGMRRVVLDSRHLQFAGAMQRWKWYELGPEALLEPAALPVSQARRLWILHGETGPHFDLAFRDIARVEAVSFGDSGAIHRPLDAAAQQAARTALAAASGIAVLADDGDRVNAVSIDAYRALLDGAQLSRIDQITDPRPGRLDHLPGFALGDMERFWLAGPESRHWLRTLEEVHRRHPDPDNAEVLALDDVYPLFWRTHWRTRRFWERAVALLN